MVARDRYMEVRAEAQYYQDVLNSTGAEYQPYTTLRSGDLCIVRDHKEAQPQPACLLQVGGERHHRDQQGE
ncbi:hypothetical protein KI387_007031, partial [Taxus chinensis]